MKPFLTLFTYLSFKKYPSKVDRWLENLNRQKWKPDDHIKGHIWSVCRNTDNNELGFVRFSSMTSNFLDNTCTKIQNMAFKTSQMDQIALEYWYYGFLGRLRVDGRGFLHQTPILKNCSPEQKSSCRTCAEACHSAFNILYALGLAHEKFDVWNEVSPQSKFPCRPLERNSSLDPNQMCRT